MEEGKLAHLNPSLNMSHDLTHVRYHTNSEVLSVPPLFLLDSGHSGGIRWSEIWQEGLLFFSFRCILSPAEFGHSGIETRMVPGLTGTECNQNPVVCLFIVCLFDNCFHTRYQTRRQHSLLPLSPTTKPIPAIRHCCHMS